MMSQCIRELGSRAIGRRRERFGICQEADEGNGETSPARVSKKLWNFHFLGALRVNLPMDLRLCWHCRERFRGTREVEFDHLNF